MNATGDLTKLSLIKNLELVAYDGTSRFNDGYLFEIDSFDADEDESYYVYADILSAKDDDLTGLAGLVTHIRVDGFKVFGDLYISRNFLYSEIKPTTTAKFINLVLNASDIDKESKVIGYGEPSVFYLSTKRTYKDAPDLREAEVTKTKLGFDDIYYV